MGFRLGNVDGRAVLVEGDGVFDLERVSEGRLGPGARAAIAGHAVLHEIAAGLAGQQPDRTLADVTLGPPQPDPWQVFAIGLNYRGHAAETGKALPEAPLVFTKFPGCLTGPVATVEMASDTTDYEAELVVVIGDTVRNVAAADAWNVVAGLTIGQDLSDRELQNAGERPAVLARQVARRLRPDRPADRVPRPARRPRRPRREVLRQRRAAPVRHHPQPDLLGSGARRVPLAHDDAARRRPDLHRHARGGGPGDGQLPALGRCGAHHDRRPRRADDHAALERTVPGVAAGGA